jgi:hypothetical protein
MRNFFLRASAAYPGRLDYAIRVDCPRKTRLLSVKVSHLMRSPLAVGVGILPMFFLASSLTRGQDTEAATALQAAQTIDLSEFPLAQPANDKKSASAVSLSYEATGTVEAIAQAIQKQLESLGWKGLDGATVTETYANAPFQKNGFHLNLSVMPNGQDGVRVMLVNQGNVDLKSLPLPSGTKQVIAMPAMLMLERNAPAPATNEECKKLLTQAGWEPFGETSATFFVRKNAVRLQVMVSPAPNDPAKSMVQFSSEQMAADFPSLTDVQGLQYSDNPTQLSFESSKDREHWVEYLRNALAEQGWEPTTDNPVKISFKERWIFRNSREESMELEFTQRENQTRVRMIFQNAALNQALEKKADAAVAKAKAEREAEMKRKANPPRITIEAPPGAKIAEKEDKTLEFSTATGAAKKGLTTWLEKQKKDGWTLKTLVDEKEAGEYELTKNDITLRAGFLDPGFIPGSITISVSGEAKLELSR